MLCTVNQQFIWLGLGSLKYLCTNYLSTTGQKEFYRILLLTNWQVSFVGLKKYCSYLFCFMRNFFSCLVCTSCNWNDLVDICACKVNLKTDINVISMMKDIKCYYYMKSFCQRLPFCFEHYLFGQVIVQTKL